jgi:hypothetical protein
MAVGMFNWEKKTTTVPIGETAKGTVTNPRAFQPDRTWEVRPFDSVGIFRVTAKAMSIDHGVLLFYDGWDTVRAYAPTAWKTVTLVKES